MARVSSKGGIVIPAEIRAAFGIKPGDEVDVVDDGECIVLVRHSSDPVRALRGMFKQGSDLTRALLDDRRREKAREESKTADAPHGRCGFPRCRWADCNRVARGALTGSRGQHIRLC